MWKNLLSAEFHLSDSLAAKSVEAVVMTDLGMAKQCPSQTMRTVSSISMVPLISIFKVPENSTFPPCNCILSHASRYGLYLPSVINQSNGDIFSNQDFSGYGVVERRSVAEAQDCTPEQDRKI